MGSDHQVMDYIFKNIRGKWKQLENVDNSNTGVGVKTTEFLIKDLHSKTLIEMVELYNRQCKIFKMSITKKLPDKGAKIKARIEEIEEAIKKKRKEKDLSVENRKDLIEEFEWNNTKDPNNTEAVTESKNDLPLIEKTIIDPLELFATHSLDITTQNLQHLDIALRDSIDINCTGTSSLENGFNNLKIEENNNLKEEKTVNSILSFKFSEDILKKSDNRSLNNSKKKPFKTNKPLNPFSPKLTALKRSSNFWVESSATGPLQKSKAESTQNISLSESIQRLNDIQAHHNTYLHTSTSAQLGERGSFKIGLPDRDFTTYRDVNTDHHILEESSDEEDENSSSY